MAKDPAFLFYPNDWIGGTMGMTFEEKGAYVELLMLQFNRGHMTKHMIDRTVGQLWVKVEDKFRMDKDGLYYNARLDKEKDKRKNFTESRRNNVLGKNQHSNKSGHMTSHMENVNINVNNIDNTVFNTMPILKNFNGLPENKIPTAKEFVKIISQKDLTDTEVRGMWEIFKVQNLTGKKYYADEEAVYSHFFNWIKKQDFKNGSTIKSNSTSNRRDAAANGIIEELKQEFNRK